MEAAPAAVHRVAELPAVAARPVLVLPAVVALQQVRHLQAAPRKPVQAGAAPVVRAERPAAAVVVRQQR